MMPPLPQIPNGLIAVSPLSLTSIGVAADFALSGYASAVWPVSNKIIYIPFRLGAPLLVTQMFCSNGATASGNVDIGIYDVAGTKIVSSGSTAQAGTTTLQLFDITNTVIGPGVFYMALTLDNTTGTIRAVTVIAELFAATTGVVEETPGGFGLPATATFVRYAAVRLPMFGLSGNPTI